jgi:ferric-dicitrate binding protein FerR (iron transport regulator)
MNNDGMLDDERLRDRIDLDAWEPPEPPADFVSRVVTEAHKAHNRRSRRAHWQRARWVGGIAAIAAVAAAALLLLTRASPKAGALVAQSRTTARVGDRALAVAEQGTHLAWRGDVVTQDRGDAFYRVEPGGPFRVTTPAGDVDVRGTCFRVKVGNEMNRRDV